MRKFYFLFVCLALATMAQAATVYTRLNAKPAEGWPGTYIIVYEKSDTEALIWNGEDESDNYVAATITDGQITSEDLADYQIVVTQEGSNKYYVKAKKGFIGCEAKKNTLVFSNGRLHFL